MELKVGLPVISILLFLFGIFTGYAQFTESYQEWLEKGWQIERDGEYEKI